MENSRIETLNLPSHRRRPLRSQTSQSLLRILSIFDEKSQPSVSQAAYPDSGGTESGAATRDDEDSAHANMMSDELLLQNESTDIENRSVLGMQERSCANTHEKIVGSEDNTNLIKLLANKNLDASPLTSDLEYQSSVQRHHTKECTGKTEVDNKLPTREISYSINSSLDGDKVGTLNSFVNNNEKNLPMNMKVLEGVEDERQGTGMVLESPISNSCAIDSFLNLTPNKEVEEGEISGEIIDFSLENDLSCQEKKGEEEHFSEEVTGKEHGNSNLLSKHMSDNVVISMEAEIREPKRSLVEYNSEIFMRAKPIKSVKLNGYRGKLNIGETKKQGSGVKKSDSSAVCLKNLVHAAGASTDHTPKTLGIVSSKKNAVARNTKKRQCPPANEKKGNKKIYSSQDKFELAVPGKPIETLKAEGNGCRFESTQNKKQDIGVNKLSNTVSPEKIALLEEPAGENLSQSKENASAEKDGSVSGKKRKRVKTKESKARKRQKAKMKQALKNGKSLVKRPKLQPVLEQKPVSYCRHYIRGRCDKGALCNFSHDTTPLTKSEPCSFFANGSCMKGDQCPYDHELLKYPCKKFHNPESSCSRGVDCLFSHEPQAIEGGSSPASKTSRPDRKSLSLLDNSSSIAQASLLDKSSSIAQAPKVAVTTSKPAAHAPRGISFLSHGKFFQEAGLSPKSGDGVKVDHLTARSASDVAQNNQSTKKPPAVAPRGINFLSFGNKPLIEFPNAGLPLERKDGIGKSPLSNSSKGKQADSSNQISQSHPNDPSNSAFPVDFHPNKEAAAPALLQNREAVHGKFLSPTSSSQKSILPNTPASLQKVLNSTFAFASKLESEVKMARSVARPGLKVEAGSSTNGSSKASTILDFLYGQSSKTKFST